MSKAKAKSSPAREPLPLSFVEGGATFILRLKAEQVRKIRARFPHDEDGFLVAPQLYLDGLAEAVIVDEDGAPVFAEGEVAGLFDPWQREVQTAVSAMYTPAPKKNSPTATTSQASSPSMAADEPSRTLSAGSEASTSP